MKRLFLIRQTSSLRQITEQEAIDALTAEEQRLDRVQIEVAMSQFAESIEQGDWSGQDRFLREQAANIREQIDGSPEAGVHYLGLAEVPHIIALGAHFGDERNVEFHDHDRDSGSWNWSVKEQTVDLITSGDHDLSSVVKARGETVIRVAISAQISDADVREVVGDETLADIVIFHRDPVSAAVARIRSAADVDAVRREFRRVYALLRNSRPNGDTVHLFVAAPPSVCFAIGQELSLRNSPPVQLYRFRKSTDRASQQQAILLTAAGEEQVGKPLTEDEVRIAAKIRSEIWPRALADIKNYVDNKKANEEHTGPWYRGLQPKEVERCLPFPALPSLKEFAPLDASVDPEPFPGEYGFERTTKRWRLSDRLLLGLTQATGGDDEQLRQLIRLFLFHEYLHDYHSITKNTADEVGKFANCLEYLDYTADTYAILHQLDLSRTLDSKLLNEVNARKFLSSQVELAIKSFWAFDTDAGSDWQVRRIRRYLNWYWRLVQLENASSLECVMPVFCRPPHVEIGGLYQVVRGRRLVALLNRPEISTYLELGIVLENDKLFRMPGSPSANLPALLQAFVRGDHDAIKQFFRTVYDTAIPWGGVQPSASTPTNT